MRKYILLFLFTGFVNIFAQFDLDAGMGLAYFSNPDLVDYLNGGFANNTNSLKTFNSSADFFLELGFNLKENYQIAAEYNFNIFSFNSPLNFSNYNLSVYRHKPSIIAYYILPGNGFKFKFGAGAGLRFLQAEESIYGPVQYSSTGIGFLLKTQGNTKLSNKFYAIIASELRYDLPGEIHTKEKQLINFNSLSVGLKLGISYQF